MANLYDMYYAQAMNLALADKQCPEANRWAARCRADFRRDSLLCDSYNHQIGPWQMERDDDPKAYRLHLMERQLPP